MSDEPSKHDPRLDIPDVLKKPVHVPGVTDKPKPGSSLGGLGEVGKALSIGLDFLAIIAAGGLLGYGIDWWLGWSPKGLVVGILIGFVWGTIRLIRRLQ